ncbi:hypothetical protein ATCC90586_001176 [Pythium insidiosum]|nr:hypothetical protein ATCC90586_001176 [Pythium insidiosum]
MPFDDTGASSLEQFTLLAKNARGRACVALIQQALSNKKLFVYRELLDMPNVQGLRGTEHDGYVTLLEVFAFGTYSDYVAKKQALPELTPVQTQKLRKLTTVSLAQHSKRVPYDVLMRELGVDTVRELEDIVIEAIYSGLIQGKLDQQSKMLIVKYAVGRDIKDADIDLMVEKLTKWKTEAVTICTKIDSILTHADELAESDKYREESIRAKSSRAAAERAKERFGPAGIAGGSFRNDDFGMDFGLASRRGPMMPKRGMSGSGSATAGSRKGRF